MSCDEDRWWERSGRREGFYDEDDAVKWRDAAGDVVWDRVPFGKAPDTFLTALLGVDVKTFRKERHRRRIDVFLDRAKRRVRIDWDEVPLGAISDREIARLLRVGASRVVSARSRKGIPPIEQTRFTSSQATA